MAPELTDALCTKCGLCCDGSLFADVELASSAEVTGLEILGLDVEDDDANAGLLSLPCRAHVGRLCAIYAHRPKCCRTFECGLLQDAREGTVGVERALEHIAEALEHTRRVRTLLVQLGEPNARLPLNERSAMALARDMTGRPGMRRKQTQLEAAMTALENRIQTTFLGRGAPKA